LNGPLRGAEGSAPMPPLLPAAHRRRLREVWRSAGWPWQDGVEAELLDAGLLWRRLDEAGRATVHLSDAGVAALAAALRANRAARDAHEALVHRVAREMQRAGRIVWTGLTLRARVGDGDEPTWAMAMPDVYSIRHTTVEAYVEPVVHEVKVSRADLLADLRQPAKRAAYLDLAGECWYVIREGIARADEIPPECGVLVAGAAGLEVARPARRRPMTPGFPIWMALARAPALESDSEGAQDGLGAPAVTPGPGDG
jgi:hypothetical protein